jgi:hypothetical protein
MTMNPTSPARCALRLAIIMTAFATVFAVIAIPKLKAQAPNTQAPSASKSLGSSPPTELSEEDEKRGRDWLDCIKTKDRHTFSECRQPFN